jgi:hypothetical protein
MSLRVDFYVTTKRAEVVIDSFLSEATSIDQLLLHTGMDCGVRFYVGETIIVDIPHVGEYLEKFNVTDEETLAGVGSHILIDKHTDAVQGTEFDIENMYVFHKLMKVNYV